MGESFPLTARNHQCPRRDPRVEHQTGSSLLPSTARPTRPLVNPRPGPGLCLCASSARSPRGCSREPCALEKALPSPRDSLSSFGTRPTFACCTNNILRLLQLTLRLCWGGPWALSLVQTPNRVCVSDPKAWCCLQRGADSWRVGAFPRCSGWQKVGSGAATGSLSHLPTNPNQPTAKVFLRTPGESDYFTGSRPRIPLPASTVFVHWLCPRTKLLPLPTLPTLWWRGSLVVQIPSQTPRLRLPVGPCSVFRDSESPSICSLKFSSNFFLCVYMLAFY